MNKLYQQNQIKFNEEQSNTAAFVLCHPIKSALCPISKELPPCLFPLCNIPVLFYNLNWIKNNTDKIYLICQDSHKSIIQKYINQWQKTITFKHIEILSVSDQNYQINSIGDSIRWIYSSSSVVLNFKNCIIVPGDVVINAPLNKILKMHETRMKNTKKGKGTPILTTIFTQTKTNGYSVLLDKDGSILQIDIPPEINFDDKNHQLPFTKTKSTLIKTGLKDTQIYICSPELMGIFASDDNFDWDSIMDDCVPSIIDCEFDRKVVYAAILRGSFSSDLNNLQNYIDSSSAVIRRRFSSINLEANFSAPSHSRSLLFDQEESLSNNSDNDYMSKNISTDYSEEIFNYEDDDQYEEDEEYDEDEEELSAYKLESNYVYIDANANISENAVVGPSAVIGRGCTIGDNCVIKNSVIGSNCTIENGVVIENSIIWDSVKIEENVHIDHSLIASNVCIKKDVKIQFGNIFSFNLEVDKDIPPCRRLTRYEIEDNNENEIEFRSYDVPQWLEDYIHDKTPIPLSDDDKYIEYIPCPESEIPSLYLWYKLSPNTFPIDLSNLDNNEKENENNEEDENKQLYQSDILPDLNLDFINEAVQFLSNLFKDSIKSDQIRSEFVILKNSKNAEYFENSNKVENIDCAVSIAVAISKYYSIAELKEGFSYLDDLFKLFLYDIDNQENFLYWWQEYCAESQKGSDLFNHGLDSFIELGFVSDAALNEWGSEQEDSSEAQLNLLNQYRNWECA